MTQAALDRAAAVDALVSAAVVDQGGHLVHFQRMDRAEIAGPTLAVDKAFTAVAHRIATAELRPLTAPGGPLQGMHANGGGRYVVFAGGLPCWADGVVVGGIGVSGGSGGGGRRLRARPRWPSSSPPERAVRQVGCTA